MTIQFSRWLAIVGGFVTPLLETRLPETVQR